MLFDPLAQLLGLLACAIGVTAFLQRQDRKLRLHLTLNGVLLTAHFMLLGATAAAINCLLCAIRTWVSGYHRTLGLVLPQLEHPVQLLTLIGTTLSTYALFRLEGLLLRWCMLASSLCWVIHNLWAGSIGGILLEGMFLVINGYTIFSFCRSQRTVQPETVR